MEGKGNTRLHDCLLQQHLTGLFVYAVLQLSFLSRTKTALKLIPDSVSFSYSCLYKVPLKELEAHHQQFYILINPNFFLYTLQLLLQLQPTLIHIDTCRNIVNIKSVNVNKPAHLDNTD